MYVQRVPRWSASPVSPDPRTVPSQSTSPCGLAAWTLSQSTRMNVNGHAAKIHPIVPPTRIRPNSFCGSLILANAIEFAIELVGTYNRQCTIISPKKGQKDVV